MNSQGLGWEEGWASLGREDGVCMGGRVGGYESLGAIGLAQEVIF